MTTIGSGPSLDTLALDNGCFAMIAMDQRESLRQLMDAGGKDGSDPALVDFKLAVAEELAPAASGFLIDHDFGFRPVVEAGALPDACGLILAADVLDQPPGRAVADTDLSDDVLRVAAGSPRTSAAKLLIIWKDDGGTERRLGLAERFVARCRELDLLSVLEGVAVAHPADDPRWDLDAAILDAARELGGLRPDLYKAQVPGRGLGAADELDRACERLTDALVVPWVVLSNGVPLEAFPRAVEAACRAGASGMLAGRALWSDAVAAPDLRGYLREHCLPRLHRLRDIVGTHARPWTQLGRG
jgi:sulfofructosephosphate aldolase